MLFKIFLIAVAFLGVLNVIMYWPISPQDKAFYFNLFMKMVSIFVAIVAILLLFGVLIA